jgi:hypothetical protein
MDENGNVSSQPNFEEVFCTQLTGKPRAPARRGRSFDLALRLARASDVALGPQVLDLPLQLAQPAVGGDILRSRLP